MNLFINLIIFIFYLMILNKLFNKQHHLIPYLK